MSALATVNLGKESVTELIKRLWLNAKGYIGTGNFRPRIFQPGFLTIGWTYPRQG